MVYVFLVSHTVTPV